MVILENKELREKACEISVFEPEFKLENWKINDRID